MNYRQTMDFLLKMLPMYQRIGKAAFKKDLTNIIALCNGLGNPQTAFCSIHIAGTNGKGSSAYMIQAVFQKAGYRAGLYTSPHLKSFTERIRVNNSDVEESFVSEFVSENKLLIEKVQPSFFEITVAMAFDYFAKSKVDIAVIETGLGGRLDSTNIITPLVSLITNISFDHTDMLGNTLEAIATEKAGIIKEKVPVVIGESDSKSSPVFINISKTRQAPVTFADKEVQIVHKGNMVRFLWNEIEIGIPGDISPDYQLRNIPGVLCTLTLLMPAFPNLHSVSLGNELRNLFENGRIKGRWQYLGKNPLVICDTAHNLAGVQSVMEQLKLLSFHKLWIIWGMVNDKDIGGILNLLPKNAGYVFCQASIPRAMPAEKLLQIAQKEGIRGRVIHDVNTALDTLRKEAGSGDIIFIGGSTFVVAELKEL